MPSAEHGALALLERRAVVTADQLEMISTDPG
jgi:hypothetical protein